MKGKTIIKFKNGDILELPEEMYESMTFYQTGMTELHWLEDGFDKKVAFKCEDVLYVMRATQSTQKIF